MVYILVVSANVILSHYIAYGEPVGTDLSSIGPVVHEITAYCNISGKKVAPDLPHFFFELFR